jgi:aryl-alcohol dehydrogenase-like predicted oxidoreductase
MSSSSAAVEVLARRLVLGGAGLGMAYGGRERPDEGRVVETLAAAAELGIPAVDTAPAYGCSEERVGRYWRGAVWTKTGPGQDLGESLARLGRERVEVLQWHNWTLEHGSAFRRLREAEASRVDRFGMTVYGAENAAAALAAGGKVVQLPWNLLDQAPVNEVASAARTAGCALAARSVYLQGLLAGRQPPPAASGLAPAIARIARAAAEHGVPPAVFALRAALDHPALDHVLIGCDHPDQLRAVSCALRCAPVGPRTELAAAGEPGLDPRGW